MVAGTALGQIRARRRRSLRRSNVRNRFPNRRHVVVCRSSKVELDRAVDHFGSVAHQTLANVVQLADVLGVKSHRDLDFSKSLCHGEHDASVAGSECKYTCFAFALSYTLPAVYSPRRSRLNATEFKSKGVL